MKLPRTPLAVILDLDGLLIDSEQLVFEAMRQVAPRFGQSIDLPFFLTLVGHSRADSDQRLIVQFGADFPLADFHAATSAHITGAAAPGAALKAGVREVLDVLDARCLKRALCTSSGPDWVRRHFEAHELTDRFNAVIKRGDYVNAKPHPEPYFNAAAALGVAPQDCLALEDSHNGVRSAHAAGMMTIMVPDMLAPNEEMQAKTIHIAQSLHDVAALLSA